MVTYDGDKAWIYGMRKYEFVWQQVDESWVREVVWCDDYYEAKHEALRAAELFGTGRYRIYGPCYGEDMWRDELGKLHVTKSGWDRVPNDYKGMTDGKRSIMPPLELGYSTCLLTEGRCFKYEPDKVLSTC